MRSRRLLAAAIACFILAAVVYAARLAVVARLAGIYGPAGEYGEPGGAIGPGAGRGGAPAQRWAKAAFSSNGERIYYVAVDETGSPIPFTDGPPWLATHGASCVDCHGPDGRGGLAIIPGGGVSPDIRYAVLTGNRAPARQGATVRGRLHYADATIKRSITEGLDADGRPLDPVMPRFKMSDRDLNDLIDYLKQLDKPSHPVPTLPLR